LKEEQCLFYKQCKEYYRVTWYQRAPCKSPPELPARNSSVPKKLCRNFGEIYPKMCRMGFILPSFQKLDRYRLKFYIVKAINTVIERDLQDVLKGNIVNIMPGQHSDIHYKNVDKELLTIMEDAREIPQTEQTEQAEQVSSPEAARIA